MAGVTVVYKNARNANERFHSKIWRKESRDNHCEQVGVKFACQATVLEHCFEYTFSSIALHSGFPNSKHTQSVRV